MKIDNVRKALVFLAEGAEIDERYAADWTGTTQQARDTHAVRAAATRAAIKMMTEAIAADEREAVADAPLDTSDAGLLEETATYLRSRSRVRSIECMRHVERHGWTRKARVLEGEAIDAANAAAEHERKAAELEAKENR